MCVCVCVCVCTRTHASIFKYNYTHTQKHSLTYMRTRLVIKVYTPFFTEFESGNGRSLFLEMLIIDTPTSMHYIRKFQNTI